MEAHALLTLSCCLMGKACREHPMSCLMDKKPGQRGRCGGVAGEFGCPDFQARTRLCVTSIPSLSSKANTLSHKRGKDQAQPGPGLLSCLTILRICKMEQFVRGSGHSPIATRGTREATEILL